MDTRRTQPVLNRRGQALSEYAMLVAMVGMGLVVILGLFGRATKQAWQKSESKFADEPSVAAVPSPSPSGGGVASGSTHPTPPPSSAPASPPKKASSDSSSAAADSLGGSADNPANQAPDPGQEPSPDPRW